MIPIVAGAKLALAAGLVLAPHHAPPASVTVTPGQSLSVIAAGHGAALATVEADNERLAGNFDLIEPGWRVWLVPGHGGHAPAVAPAPPAASPAPAPAVTPDPQPNAAPAASSGPVTAGGLEGRIIMAESGGQPQVMNASGHYGLYQFDLPTWISGGGAAADFGHASVAEQERVFASVYAARGSEPWQGDGAVP